MKRLLLIALSIGLFSLGSASCSLEIPIDSPEKEQPGTPGESDNPEDNENDNSLMNNKLKVIVGTTSFIATLSDNAAVTNFRAMLPMTVSMSEMNGNEKLYYLPSRLPTSASSAGSILFQRIRIRLSPPSRKISGCTRLRVHRLAKRLIWPYCKLQI